MSEQTAVTLASQRPQITYGSGLTITQDLTLSQLGATFAKSGYFKNAQDAAQCVVKVLAGQELGITPVAAMRGIHVFDGNIMLYAGLLTSLIERSPLHRIRVLESTDKRCEIEFWRREAKLDGSGHEWVQPGPSASFTIEEAQHLLKKDNWRMYPADMLFARAMARGFRRYCMALAAGPVFIADARDDIAREEEPTVNRAPLAQRIAEAAQEEPAEAQEAPSTQSAAVECDEHEQDGADTEDGDSATPEQP